MRLLERKDNGEFSLTEGLDKSIPAYAILSHTWGDNSQKVTFKDLVEGLGKSKAGYQKIRFCGDSADLQKSINSMFRWYKNAVKCYVYLSDVSILDEKAEENESNFSVESVFRNARWFTRGWTLQELLAPSSVEFFSTEYKRIGDKLSLKCLIHEITGIPVEALQGYNLTKFSNEERVSWIANRETKLEEDIVYSLLGIFGIFLPLIYGEGREHAFQRLLEKVDARGAKRNHELDNFLKSIEKKAKFTGPFADAAEVQHTHKAQLDQLLRSLRDDNINTRKNQIDKHYSKTFSWIFDPEGQRPWGSFPQWLSSNEKLYWVRGKAGSGKSTLMKFLVDANETKEYLDQHAPDHVIYSYFIWNSGTVMQKGITGLLCSLIYQIFDKNYDIMEDALKKWPHISKVYSTHDWSRDFLEQVLLWSLALHKQPVCIFLDGLDEIDQQQVSSNCKGPYYLLHLIEEISSCSDNSVKICVSSRPEPAFHADLKKYPKLQLQDLTKQDVDAYARDFVHTRCSFEFKDITENEFIEEIVNKADGVFLWVSLALQSLQRGIASGDRLEELMGRLRKLPRKLEEIYENMFKRLGEDQEIFKKTAALYFNVFIAIAECIDVVNSRGPERMHWNLLKYAIAFNPALRDTLLNRRQPPTPRILKYILLDFDRRLTSRCAGLLEVVSTRNSERDIDKLLSRNIKRPWDDITIQFIHRSAREFLVDADKRLLDNDETPPSDCKFRILQAIVLDDLYPPKHHQVYNNAMMDYMANTEPLSSQEEEIEILNLAQEIYQRNEWHWFYEVTASAMVSYLFNRGADPNWLGLAPMDIRGQLVYFPTPLLGYFFDLTVSSTRWDFWNKNTELIEKIIQVFLGSGVDLERKFLTCKFGILKNWFGLENETARPFRRGKSLNSTAFDLIIERNCLDIILESLEYRLGHKAKALFSKFGLHVSGAYRKVLLYCDEDAVYQVNDEDSDAVNKLLHWPESLLLMAESFPTEANRLKEERKQKLREILRGKKVENAIQWLIDKDYMVLQASDVEGISDQTSVHDMAEIYWRLNERFRSRPSD